MPSFKRRFVSSNSLFTLWLCSKPKVLISHKAKLRSYQRNQLRTISLFVGCSIVVHHKGLVKQSFFNRKLKQAVARVKLETEPQQVPEQKLSLFYYLLPLFILLLIDLVFTYVEMKKQMMFEHSRCKQEFELNNCEKNRKLPAMISYCSSLEKCMTDNYYVIL